MSIDKRWFLVLALVAGAATGAVVAWNARRGLRRTAPDLEHAADLKSWENEGGNLTPMAPAASAAGTTRLP
jgi:hypothetical protein